MAAGTASSGEGSKVPVQSNSAMKRDRPGAGVFAAWLMTQGRTDSWSSERTWRKPETLGPHSHLCRLPVV